MVYADCHEEESRYKCIRQFPKGGTNVKIRDEANQIDLLRVMVEEQAAQIRRLAENSEKNKNKRAEEREKTRQEREAAEREYEQQRAAKEAHDSNPQHLNDMDIEVNPDDEESSTAEVCNTVTKPSSTRMYIHAIINDISVQCLVVVSV